MSASPRLRRVSSVDSLGSAPGGVDDLVNYYEAEEERIINLLSRKLEQLRVEKIQLENALEAESESHVNRLNRELTALRRQQLQQQANGTANSDSSSVPNGTAPPDSSSRYNPRLPSTEVMLDALRRENDSLRNRLADLEREHLRVKRLNAVYREELIDYRTNSGLSTDSLIGLDGVVDNDYVPYPRRATPNSSSPGSVVLTLSARNHRPPSGGLPVPIPRLSSTTTVTNPYHSSHYTRDADSLSAGSSVTHSPTSSSASPYTFSPVHGASFNPASYVSTNTNLTTPPSSASLQSNPPLPYPMPPPQLTYPSVPPPSLSSSLGSPVIPFQPGAFNSVPENLDLNGTNATGGSINTNIRSRPVRRRGSSSARVAETGSLRDISENRSRSRRQSIEQGINVTTSTPIPIRNPRGGNRESTPVVRE